MNWYELGIKSLLRRRKKTLILFTAIVLAVFIITAFTAAYQGMMQAVEEGVKKYGNTYRLTPKDDRKPISYQGIPILPGSSHANMLTLSKYDLKFLQESHEGLIGMSPRVVKGGLLDEGNQDLVLVGIDINQEQAMKPWWRVWGSWPKEQNEILVGYDLGTHFNWRAGDEISIFIHGQETMFQVAGMLHYTGHVDDRLLFTTYEGMEDEPIHFIEMVVAFGQSQELTTPPGWEWKEQRGPLQEERLGSIEKISELSSYIIGVTILLGLLIVVITLLNEVGERKSEFALLQAVGIKKKMIIKILLFEVAILSFIGSLIGIVLGIIMANIWSGLMSGLQFFALLTFHQMIILVALIMVATMTISLYPISKALKQEPISLLRHE
jgi:putative ABC transport system permease protein